MTISSVSTHTRQTTLQSAVQLSAVVVAFGGFPALAGVDLQVRPGELVALRGANGSGKTTLLRLCAGLVPVTRGTAEVFGVDLVHSRSAIRSHVGIMGHQNGLYGELTARENVAFTAALVGAGAQEVESALIRLGIDERVATTRTRVLSAGQRRRTALASLVVRRAKLWLLDEPHAGLDAQARRELDRVLHDATLAGATVVYTTHEAAHVGADGAPRTITMAGGVVVRDEPATETKPLPR